MQCRTLVFPGNHDATHAVSLVNEATAGFTGVRRAFASTQTDRRAALAEAVAPHPLAGYDSHQVGPLTLICARPHSMGGPTLTFGETLRQAYGIDSLEASTARLCALVDEAPSDDLVFVSHNGPSGLGAARDAIWGADFKKGAGDWGDPDLREAIEHARDRGKRVRAVVAGHMHRRLRGGGRRPAIVEERGTCMVNAAEVPRIRDGRHHHVAVTITDDAVQAVDRFEELA